MSTFMADRHLPGVSLETLAEAQRAAIATSEGFTLRGRPVRYIRSTWIPGEDRVQCLFEAGDVGLVAEVNRAAGIPFTRIIDAVDLTPGSSR